VIHTAIDGGENVFMARNPIPLLILKLSGMLNPVQTRVLLKLCACQYKERNSTTPLS